MTKNKFIVIISSLSCVVIALSIIYILKRDKDTQVTNQFSEEYLFYKDIFSFELSDDKTYYIITDLKKKHRNDNIVNFPDSIDNIPVKKIVDNNEKNFLAYKNVLIVNIGANIEYIGTSFNDDGIFNDGTYGDSFLTCDGSKTYEINVDINNKVYSSKNGILFNKNGDILIRYPSSKAGEDANLYYNVPSSVKNIYHKAFYRNAHIKRISLNEVEIIGDAAFYNCLNLNVVDFGNNLLTIGKKAFSKSGIISLDLPSSLNEIDDLAFAYSESLTNIYIPSAIRKFGYNLFTQVNPNFCVYTDSGNSDFLKSNSSFTNITIIEK